MLYTAYVIRKMFKITDSVTLTGIASWLPLVLAAYVCVTRIQDFKHREDDVAVGALIGMFTVSIIWRSLQLSIDQQALVHSKIFVNDS